MTLVRAPGNQQLPNNLSQPSPAPSESPLKAVGLEDFNSIPENQRKLFKAEETARVLTLLGMDKVHYKRAIDCKGGQKEVSFPFSMHGLFYTLFCRLHSYRILSSMSIKGTTNQHFIKDRADIPADIDCHIQVKEFRNVDELESIILSCFADVAGISADDSGEKRTYWQRGKKICEISPIPPKAPGFLRHRQCGRLFLQRNGLGNRCHIDNDNRKFLIYTLQAFCGDKPIKIDIHVVEKLDHQATCSYNSLHTAIHPLFFEQYNNPHADLKKVQLWAKSVDGYPLEMVLGDMNQGALVYDPPIQAATIYEGMHIHHRYLARGCRCMTPGVDMYLQEQFRRQYYEKMEEKGNGQVSLRLREKDLYDNLQAELDEHLESPREKAAFLLSLMNHHALHNSPELQKIQEIHSGLLLRIGLDPAELERLLKMLGRPFTPSLLRDAHLPHLDRSYSQLTNYSCVRPAAERAMRSYEISRAFCQREVARLESRRRPVEFSMLQDCIDHPCHQPAVLSKVFESSNKELFYHGLQAYKQLASRKEAGGKELAAMMEELLRSPFASTPKGIQEIVRVLPDICTSREDLLVVHERCLAKIIALSVKNEQSFVRAAKLLIHLFGRFRDEKFQAVQGVLRKLNRQYFDLINRFTEIQGASRCAAYLQKCFSFSFLEQDLLGLLPPFFSRLFSIGGKDQGQAVQLYGLFDPWVHKLPALQFGEIFSSLMAICRETSEEPILIKGLAKICEEGKEADQQRLHAAIEKHKFLEKYPGLKKHAYPERAKQEAAKEKNNQDALTAFRSKEPIASFAEVSAILAYLPQIDYRSAKSLKFLNTHFTSFLKRLHAFINECPSSNELNAALQALSTFFQKEALKVDTCFKEQLGKQRKEAAAEPDVAASDVQSLTKHHTNLNVGNVYSNLFIVQKLTGLTADQKFVHLSAALEILILIAPTLDPETFLQMWKEIVRIALSDETLIPNFLTLYNKLCTDSSIEAQLLAQMKSLIRQQVAVQFQLSKNPLLIEFALEKKKTDEDKRGERPKHEVVFEAAKNDFLKGELAEIANNQTNAVAYWGKSLQGFIAAIQGNPKNNEYYHEFAWAAEKLNSWQIAATVLKKGVDELGETDPIILRFLGRSYAYLQRKDAAIYYLEKAFALDKENAGLAADLITSYYQNEQYKKGIEVASAFLGRKFDIDILYLRGKLYVADGQFGKGAADLKAVMCLNSNYKDAKQSLASAEVQALKTALAGSKAGSVKTEKKKKK